MKLFKAALLLSFVVFQGSAWAGGAKAQVTFGNRTQKAVNSCESSWSSDSADYCNSQGGDDCRNTCPADSIFANYGDSCSCDCCDIPQ